uniref:Uncharacterized protein n=1 Tax=Odontella aurita TaxID=265563 RepID=A0A7S4K3H2_9STRA
MAAVREQWGAWDLEDEKEDSRPTANFDGIEYRDLPADDFPEGSWQTDKEYVTKFLDQAKGLVTRVKEGIYAEYGQPTIKPDGTKLSDAEIIERDKRFAIAHESDEDHAGKLGGMSRRSWDALVMKLLHAMMTNDEFYCVMGGHSSAAGHGNNFRQAKMMAFHYLMEPIFDKLGMRLISRNNAQGGVGTTHSAMASGSFYGEKDIVWWDSSMTEKGAGAHDIFNKQAILGGERVPILMNCPRVDIMADTNGTAWTGNNAGGQWEAGGMLLPEYVIKDAKHADTVPFALRYMLCTKEAGGLCQQHKYDSICWEPRSDFEPTAEQKAHPGSQVKWHPGVRAHLQASRIMSLVVLHALDSAIDKWTALASAHTDDTPTVPLPAEYWHVGTKYRWIQKGLRTTLSKSPDGQSACEKMLGRFPRACRVAMKGFGDWTPRRNPSESSLLAVMKPAPNGYVPHPSMPTEFAGINVMPLIQRVPDGEVDVHAIALASTKPAPRLDHSMEGGEEERRKLAELSHEAVQSRSRRAHTIHERRKRALREKELAEQRSQKCRRVEGDGTVEIVPGRGWLWGQEAHFCDGSYNSECGRQRGSDCLISGHNDGRGGFVGGGLSGWFVLTLPKVKEGLILMRMEYWMGGPGGNALTKDWTEENGGKTNDAEPKYVFPDVTPSVNVTTPFDKLKEAKKAAEAAAKDAPPAPASPANVTNPVPPPAPAAAPAVTSANSTNATRSLLRRNAARRLAATRITRASIDANADPYAGVEYPFEHLTEEEWSALTDDDFKGEGGRDRRNNNHQNHNRNLKAPPPAIPDDWKFEIAINGKMHKVMDKNEFMSHAVEIVKNWAIWPLMDDVEWSKKDWGNSEGEDVEVAVRMSSVSMPRRSLRISHVYYA